MSERRSELKAVTGGDGSTGPEQHDLMGMSAQIWEGLTQINNRMISLAQASWRHTQAAAEEMRQCQSPKEMLEIQLRLSRRALDDYMDESRKLSELLIKMSGDAMGLLRLPR